MNKPNAGLELGGGEINHARIVQALYELGPLSRADLARLTGFSRATIGTAVAGLLTRGVLAEGDTRRSSAAGGKPSRPLWFAPDAPPIAAAHLLPGSVEAALISAGGELLKTARRTFPTDSPDGTAATDSVLTALTEILDGGRTPVGIGIAVGGMVDTDTGTIVQVALAPCLDGLPIGQLVAKHFDLPAWIDLHPRVQALGDRWFGQGRGHATFASLYTGETLGVGLVVGGVVQRGAAGSGGEIGHTTVQVDGKPCRCGRSGCWGAVGAPRWATGGALGVGLPGAASLSAGPLARLAARGHPHAAELLDRYAHNIAIGMANLHQTFAPGLFILHGDTVAGGEALRSRIERHLHKAIPAHPAGPPQVAFTTLDDHATLLGAAGLVLSYSLQPPRSARPARRS